MSRARDIADSAVVINYLDSATSNIQTQINNRIQVANVAATYATKAYAAANSYVNTTLANTNSYIATIANSCNPNTSGTLTHTGTVCATTFCGSGAGLTGLNAGAVIVCSTAQICCTAGCLNYSCGNYFKFRLLGDYTLCCVLNETNATKLFFDIVPGVGGVRISTNSSFISSVPLANLTTNSKRIIEFDKVGSKWYGRAWGSNLSDSFDSYQGSSSVYAFNATGSCNCCCFNCIVSTPTATCYGSCMALRCVFLDANRLGYYICRYDVNIPGVQPQFPNNCGWRNLNNGALVKVDGKYMSIFPIKYMSSPGDPEGSPYYTPTLVTAVHDIAGSGGKMCLCNELNQACRATYCINGIGFIDQSAFDHPRIVAVSEQNDLIITHVARCSAIGGIISVDKLSAVVAGQQCTLQTICLCNPSGGCQCNCNLTIPAYQCLDNTKNIPASIWKIQCLCEAGARVSVIKYKFWKGTTACPVCHSYCIFDVCDCTSYCCSVARGYEGSGIFMSDICGKYMLIGGVASPCSVNHAFGMWSDSCWCSCTTYSISNIWCAQCSTTNNCGCCVAGASTFADEYLCHIIHFACSGCTCTYTRQNIWTRVGDTVVRSFERCGSTAQCCIPALNPGCQIFRISVWDCCIFSCKFACATCPTTPCTCYGAKYHPAICCWCREANSAWCLTTAGICGNISLYGETYSNLRDMSNNIVDFLGIRLLTAAETCAKE